jgi:hypothetical protein
LYDFRVNQPCAEIWAVSSKAFYNLGIGHNSTRPFEEGEARVKVTKLVAILNGVCALLFFLTFSEAQEKKTAVSPGMSFVYQILTPTGGVDFTDNMKDLVVRVRRNWFTFMPEGAQLGKKGRVVVRFQIQKNGTLLVKEPTVELYQMRSKVLLSTCVAYSYTTCPTPTTCRHRIPGSLPIEIILPIRVCALIGTLLFARFPEALQYGQQRNQWVALCVASSQITLF